MARFRVLGSIVLLFALIIVGVGVLGGSATAASGKPPGPPPIHQPFQISQTYVSGDPAIKPRAAQNAASNTAGPAFTQADVIAFFQKYGFFAGPVVPGAHLRILTIQFVSAKQASQLMYGESVGRPDDYLVCYVKVQGPFLLTNVSVPKGTKMPTTAKYGDAVFDAHTGNSLVWGIYFQ